MYRKRFRLTPIKPRKIDFDAPTTNYMANEIDNCNENVYCFVFEIEIYNLNKF